MSFYFYILVLICQIAPLTSVMSCDRAPTSGQPRLAYSSGVSSTPMLTGFKMWFWQVRLDMQQRFGLNDVGVILA